MRVILHIDVNSAFLSWTAVDMLKSGCKYDIRDSYAVIGGSVETRSGIVLASSIPAKKLGVKTAETLNEARKKCRALRVFPPDYTLYSKMSKSMFELLKSYTPDIEVFSIDECFIDYTKVKKLYGDEIEFARKIQAEIYEKLGFTVNIGIGNNKLCAKMASNFSKPNKIHTLYEYEMDKISDKQISYLFGIGKKTAEQLKKLGIEKVSDLRKYDQVKLSKYFKNSYLKLIDLANGIDNTEVVVNSGINKCISASTTFIKDYKTKEEIFPEFDKLVTRVSYQLRKQKMVASVIGISIKDVFFKTTNHQITLKNATDVTPEIREIVKKLFIEIWNKKEVRLVGVRLDKLKQNDNYQLSLFENINLKENDKQLDKTVDSLKEKYGFNVIKRGS